MAFERLAPRQRRSVLRFEMREIRTLGLRLGTKLFELQFAAIELRANSRQLGAECGSLGGRAWRVFPRFV